MSRKIELVVWTSSVSGCSTWPNLKRPLCRTRCSQHFRSTLQSSNGTGDEINSFPVANHRKRPVFLYFLCFSIVQCFKRNAASNWSTRNSMLLLPSYECGLAVQREYKLKIAWFRIMINKWPNGKTFGRHSKRTNWKKNELEMFDFCNEINVNHIECKTKVTGNRCPKSNEATKCRSFFFFFFF